LYYSSLSIIGPLILKLFHLYLLCRMSIVIVHMFEYKLSYFFFQNEL
jgi:hypothetical protein